MPARKAKQAKKALRQMQVADAVLGGRGYGDIAVGLGISKATVSSDVRALLRRWDDSAAQTIGEYVQIQRRELAIMHASIWERASTGDLAAQAGLLRLMERSLWLCGITSPEVLQDRLAGEQNAAGGGVMGGRVRVVVTLPDNGRGDHMVIEGQAKFVKGKPELQAPPAG